MGLFSCLCMLHGDKGAASRTAIVFDVFARHYPCKRLIKVTGKGRTP